MAEWQCVPSCVTVGFGREQEHMHFFPKIKGRGDRCVCSRGHKFLPPCRKEKAQATWIRPMEARKRQRRNNEPDALMVSWRKSLKKLIGDRENEIAQARGSAHSENEMLNRPRPSHSENELLVSQY